MLSRPSSSTTAARSPPSSSRPRCSSAAAPRQSDTEGLIDYPRSIAGVETVALVRELPEGGFKVSLRSRGVLGRRVDRPPQRRRRTQERGRFHARREHGRSGTATGSTRSSASWSERGMRNGLLLIDKPSGCTSHDVVQRVPGRRGPEEGRPLRHSRPDRYRSAAVDPREGDSPDPISHPRTQGLRGRDSARHRDRHLRRRRGDRRREALLGLRRRDDRRGDGALRRRVRASDSSLQRQESEGRQELRARPQRSRRYPRSTSW